MLSAPRYRVESELSAGGRECNYSVAVLYAGGICLVRHKRDFFIYGQIAVRHSHLKEIVLHVERIFKRYVPAAQRIGNGKGAREREFIAIDETAAVLRQSFQVRRLTDVMIIDYILHIQHGIHQRRKALVVI